MRIRDFIKAGYKIVENVEVIESFELCLDDLCDMEELEEDFVHEVGGLEGGIPESFILPRDSTYDILAPNGNVGHSDETLLEDATLEEVEDFIKYKM